MPQIVIITGGSGNLGQKAVHMLTARGAEVRIVDPWRPKWAVPHGARWVPADLTRWGGEWVAEFAGADTVLHMWADNPYLDATWEQSRNSLAGTANVARACEAHRVRRLVFFSSNHVMGGYRPDGASARDAAPIGAEDGARPGTVFQVWGDRTDCTPYAVAKMAGETICETASAASGLRAIIIRIGWCQPGENSPSTLSATGMPTGQGDEPPQRRPGDDDPDAVQRWFRLMWLSNRDFEHLIDRCVYASLPETAPKCIRVNAMSRNTSMRWQVRSAGARLLGYDPIDDVTRHISNL